MRQFSEDMYDNSSSTGAFFTGLFAGAIIGAGLGLWFAPKTGAEMREQITGTARDLGQRATQTMNDLADRGKEAMDRGREAFDRARSAVTSATDQVAQTASKAASAAANRGPQTNMSAGAERS